MPDEILEWTPVDAKKLIEEHYGINEGDIIKFGLKEYLAFITKYPCKHIRLNENRVVPLYEVGELHVLPTFSIEGRYAVISFSSINFTTFHLAQYGCATGCQCLRGSPFRRQLGTIIDGNFCYENKRAHLFLNAANETLCENFTKHHMNVVKEMFYRDISNIIEGYAVCIKPMTYRVKHRIMTRIETPAKFMDKFYTGVVSCFIAYDTKENHAVLHAYHTDKNRF